MKTIGMRCLRVFCAILSVILLSGSLLSCDLMDKLGFDTHDYMGEEIIASHNTDGETAEKLLPVLSILVTDSVFLPEFENMSQSIDAYRDAVLRQMLKFGYSKYSGNRELIEKAAEVYPEYQITQIIPADDFEAAMYEYFGGDVKITHRDGVFFKYLKKVEAYISSIVPTESGIVPHILSIDETAKTYRVRFRLSAADGMEKDYFTLIIKREDGTYYFKKLMLEEG